MGHRANLILIENEKQNINYCSGCAQEISFFLVKGLDYCVELIDKYDDGYNYLCHDFEAGLLIDMDNKKVLFFESEHLETTELQDYFIAYLKENIWLDWEIEWCNQAQKGFADYLDIFDEELDKQKKCVLSPMDASEWEEFVGDHNEKDAGLATLVSVVENGMTQDFILYGWHKTVFHCLCQGDSMNDILHSVFEPVSPEIINAEIIEECLLLDYDNKSLFLSLNLDDENIDMKSVELVWEGWNCVKHRKGIHFHFDFLNREPLYKPITKEYFQYYLKRWGYHATDSQDRQMIIGQQYRLENP